jgi:hypothetical protein
MPLIQNHMPIDLLGKKIQYQIPESLGRNHLCILAVLAGDKVQGRFWLSRGQDQQQHTFQISCFEVQFLTCLLQLIVHFTILDCNIFVIEVKSIIVEL